MQASHARFIGPHQGRVGDEILESERIFINTGGRPDLPALDGLDDVGYLTNATILDLRDLPKHLLVLGGGITGAGVALDAVLRGLRVALLDKGDFASGTSSV